MKADTQTGICFFRPKHPSTLLDCLGGVTIPELSLTLTTEQLSAWLRFGSVYVDGQRVTTNCEVHTDQIVRLHTRPKRYPFPAERLSERIVFDHPEFLVIDKPGGLPVHPTLDNRMENVKYGLEEELHRPLFTTHRLDIPTQGLLILAKTRDAQVLINRIFAKKRVQKFYKAGCEKRIEPGIYVHYLNPETRVPRSISRQPQDGWWDCRLEVLAVKQTSLGFDHQIQLITGRTHQIRAQFQEMGAPILGDETYGGRPGARLSLSCESLIFRYRTSDIEVHRSDQFRN